MRLTPGQSSSSQLTLIASLLQSIQNSNDGILAKLGQLNIDLPRFSHTQVFSVSLVSGAITQLIAPEQNSRRTSLKFASGTASKVIILHGFDTKPTAEDFLASPWSLEVFGGGIDDLDGGYGIWALAIGGDAEIKIGIEYENAPQQSLPINMQIQPLFGTGTNWTNINNWASGYDLEINSPITGYKLFSFSEFAIGQAYQFSLNPGTLSFDSLKANPINIYLFELDSILKSVLWRFFQGAITYAQLREQVLPILKNGKSWAAKLPASGGTFSLKPNHNRTIGLIDGKLTGEAVAQTLIFNYAPDTANNTGTFTLEGY